MNSPRPASRRHYGRTKVVNRLSEHGATAATECQGWECPQRAECLLLPLTGRRPEPGGPQRPA